uniref:Uncharacterized protein n=1 Tax=Oryza sativa subsp. japonica TaxID=39947 RepID=Q6ZD25_ORYSJ|nr:hypothetical protein [Oryza sativa Japonica Group]
MRTTLSASASSLGRWDQSRYARISSIHENWVGLTSRTSVGGRKRGVARWEDPDTRALSLSGSDMSASSSGSSHGQCSSLRHDWGRLANGTKRGSEGAMDIHNRFIMPYIITTKMGKRKGKLGASSHWRMPYQIQDAVSE